jgi:hypothetical protein
VTPREARAAERAEALADHLAALREAGCASLCPRCGSDGEDPRGGPCDECHGVGEVPGECVPPWEAGEVHADTDAPLPLLELAEQDRAARQWLRIKTAFGTRRGRAA